MHSHWVQASCDFLYGYLATGQAKPYGGCAEIIKKLCDASAADVHSPQIMHRNRMPLHTKALQRWCVDYARAYWCPNDHLKSCNFPKISLQPPHFAHTMLL